MFIEWELIRELMDANDKTKVVLTEKFKGPAAQTSIQDLNCRLQVGDPVVVSEENDHSKQNAILLCSKPSATQPQEPMLLKSESSCEWEAKQSFKTKQWQVHILKKNLKSLEIKQGGKQFRMRVTCAVASNPQTEKSPSPASPTAPKK